MTHFVSLKSLSRDWRCSLVPRTPRILMFLMAFFGLLPAGCQQGAASATPTQAASYSLMVINGSGGGKYQAGSTVHVWAEPYQRGWTFDMWEEDTQFIPDIRSMHA